MEVDKKYNKIFFIEDIIKESEKLPKKIKDSLEKGKIIANNWKDNKLNSLINDCLNIENNINEINKVNLSLANFNSNQDNISFIHSEKEINQIFDNIKNFGIIRDVNFSEIIKENDFNKINELIGGNIKFVLKYSAKRDCCNTDIFNEKCDNINGCIIICKVQGSDIIVGYLSTKIEKKNEFSDDEKAFLFNLSKNIIKKNKKSYKNAIKNFNDSSLFIRFGSDCEIFTLSGNCLNDNKSYAKYCN